MRKPLLCLSCVLACLLAAACQSTGGASPGDGKTAVATPRPSPDPAADPDPAALAEMKTHADNAGRKLDEMAVSEAVHLYVAALAVKARQVAPSRDMLALAEKIESELTRIESGFLLQAGPEWLDADGGQIASSTYPAGKGDALGPKVMLWYNVGGSRIAVSAAPVLFEFVKGTGLLTGFASTNEYGEASVPLARIDQPNRENVIRASLAYTVQGFTYRFAQTRIEFVYLPPSRRATLIVLERGPGFSAEDPYIFNPVYESLKRLDFDFIPFNGRLLGQDFMNVFGGDLKALGALPVGQSVPYLAVVLNDCYSVRKLPHYESAFLGEGRATLRIVRVADGKILFEAVGYADKAHDTHAQGNTAEKTMRDAFSRASAALTAEIGLKQKDIVTALGLQ